MPAALDAIVAELSESDRQERIDLLIDFAKNLPPLPERLAALKDASHRVEECQSPVYLFVEMVGPRVVLYADAPIEAPTVRGFVSLLLEGLNDATVEEVLKVPPDLVERCACRKCWACFAFEDSAACCGGSRARSPGPP